MLKVSSVEFQRQLGHFQDAALKEPITITRHGRDRLVLLDVEEFKRLRQRARLSLTVDELSEDDIKRIQQTHMSTEYNHLNIEIDE